MSSNRRDFVKISLAVGAGLFLPLGFGLKKAAAQVPGGTLNLAGIPKYMTRLFVPPAMPMSGPRYYEIAVRQFARFDAHHRVDTRPQTAQRRYRDIHICHDPYPPRTSCFSALHDHFRLPE